MRRGRALSKKSPDWSPRLVIDWASHFPFLAVSSFVKGGY